MDMMSLYLQLSDTLGWGSMRIDVALPALHRIVSHYIGIIFDTTGDIIAPENAVSALIEHWRPDYIFALLVVDDVFKMGTEKEREFISIRLQIEGLMKDGFEFIGANWFE